MDEHYARSKEQLISKWDQLLASDARDFLISSNGDHVPISSLKGKVIGLYFCENVPNPPRMEMMKRVYQEAKLRKYAFGIVQINFHYHCFNAIYFDTDPTVQHCCEDVSWLTLPFGDPSCRKLQRIFKCEIEYNSGWDGDCLVIVDTPNKDYEGRGVFYEFLGVEIVKRWGIEGYPFTRVSLYETEYKKQNRELTLQSLFPPGELFHRLQQTGSDGKVLVDSSQLFGKRVLVLFGPHSKGFYGGEFLSMLKTQYRAQQGNENVAEEGKFEVVYVSTGYEESLFEEFTNDMPWLVRPYSPGLGRSCFCKAFKAYDMHNEGAAAFNEDGELIAKNNLLQHYKLRFPFVSLDLKSVIRFEVEQLCHIDQHPYLFS